MAGRVRHAAILECGEGEHRRPQGLVADQPVDPRDHQETSRSEMVEVLVHRFGRVEVVLGEGVALRRVAAQRVGEAEVDGLVAGIALGERRASVSDLDVNARQAVGRPEALPQIVIDYVDDRAIELDHVDAPLAR